MKCPWCNERLETYAPAEMNSEIYGNTNTVLTKCCNNFVQTSRQIIIHVEKHWQNDDLTKDDWGYTKDKK